MTAWRAAPAVLAGLAVVVGAGALAAAVKNPSLNPATNPALAQVEADQRAREHDRDAALAAAQAARAEVLQLQGQLAALDADQGRGRGGISLKRLTLAGLAVREEDLRARMGGDQNRLARLLTALEMFRRDPPPALLVDPRDVRDAVRAAILVKAMTPELERRAAALKAQATELKRLRRQADTASEALITSESALAEQRAKLEDEILSRTQAARQSATEAAAAAQDIEALEARAQALRDVGHGLAAGTTAPPVSARLPPDPEHAGLFGRQKLFQAPVAGALIRRFNDSEPGGGERSRGWTWRTKDGPAVVAPAAAIVDYAGPLKGFGVVLILRMGGGYHLVLAGLETATAAPGQTVSAGQPVGRMAKLDSPPPDLYLEIRKNGAPVDPALWLKAPDRTARR
ncbi:murein hydrolase activator EnvC family protein [Phenylobacterium montanum]|uniref:Peptidoglycan DD-metalloendopeptidase family protein n=1 Tax=Phenylobacterium montanum TaxID=2823693 RepID=A0A975IV10_9CAUL|nr:peptidoglycan DD-metalloendopeptidase family protein [Caulobacter sp. S6]QUD86821.1 peptidoglycan DD-metalloendopeptidase family protein [Caulobacter sp. S6]